MSELTASFQSLPPEYQHVLRLAQDQHQITVAPLQTLVGGWSGAMVFLVSISWNESKRVEHCILKLDHKSKTAKSDEVTRHKAVLEKSSPDFAREHIAELVFDRVEHEGAVAIFYRIAGQSLLQYRPLSNYERRSQLKTLVTKTTAVLLDEWNSNPSFQQAVHPQTVLKQWLGFRLDAGASIEQFLMQTRRVDPDIDGVLINGHVFPNPLLYARNPERWGDVRSIDVLTGFIHGDLNTNNILAKFSTDKETLDGYYLIDFALFKEDMPLLYDQRYLEMSYLMQGLTQLAFATSVEFLTLLAVADVPDPHRVPIETSGICDVIATARTAFADWVREKYPSLHDDLWGQYWLAGVAAGLAYCHKAGQPDEVRLAGLIYASANLRRYLVTFKLPLPTNVRALYDESLASSDSSATAKVPVHNLPAQPTPFIGRAAQVAELKRLIQDPDVRLVTLLGPGGTGKTRLSLQVANEVLDQFTHGVFFVPLADDTNSDQLIARIAQHLEVRAAGRPLLENIKDFLREKRILLVLDNFEQLVSAAPVVAELLATAPGLKFIASSRVALQLHGERQYPVPPLDLPQSDELAIEELSKHESVILFVSRAQASSPSFMLTGDNASAVAEICRRLDGLPLALELAAARIKLLPPQAILSRLDDRLKLLTGGARDLPSRHQTLRNTLEWSYSLLNEDEKKLYARLSVFVGGFTLDAAEAVCNPNGQLDILDGVTSLVNNSLLRQQESTDPEPRFGMLETIREYAWERLKESGDLPEVQRNHAEYFARMVIRDASDGLLGPESTAWLNKLETEHGNIQAALAWCQTPAGGPELAFGMLATLTWFWYRRGFFNEGRVWTDQILAASESAQPLIRAAALQMSSRMALWRGDLNNAVARAKAGLVLWQRLEDEQTVPMSLLETGVVLINMGQDREAHALLKEAEALFRDGRKSYFHAITLVHLGNVALGLGNVEESSSWLEQAHPRFEQMGEPWGLSFVLNNLGEVSRVKGDYKLARGYYKESESLLRTTGDKGDLARLVHTLGYIATHEENYEQAEKQFRESLVMFRRLGNRRGMAECMAGLAGLRARQGNAEWGAVMLSAAENVLKSTGGAWWPADRVEVEANQEIIRAALGEAELAAADKKGRTMTLDQALTFASE